MKQRALDFLNDPNKKEVIISVVGDLAVDHFVFGKASRLSPEAPVPVLIKEREEWRLGCAANVALNVSNLFNTKVKLFGSIGLDRGGIKLEELLDKYPNIEFIPYKDDMWKTPIKTRYIADDRHQLLRIDDENKAAESQWLDNIPPHWEAKLKQSDIIICQDYGKSMFVGDLLKSIIEFGLKENISVFVDPNKNTPSFKYSYATLLSPNIEEAAKIINFSTENTPQDTMGDVAGCISSSLNIPTVLITRGKFGMTGSHPGGIFHLPSFAKQVFDVTGAGDTVIACMAVFCAMGCDIPLAAFMANAAASAVISQVGTASVSVAGIIETLGEK